MPDTSAVTKPAPAQPSRGHRAWIPAFVLVAGLTATGAGTAYVRMSTATKDRLRFQIAVQRTQDAIAGRLQTYTALLEATQGLFAASREVTREEFTRYVGLLELRANFPGIQGVGYTRRVRPGEQAALVESMAAEGLPEFHIWPDHPRDEYHAIVYLEPFDWRNQRAIGFDMFTDPTRRLAMERARDTGRPAASGKVILVQETEEQPQAGFLIYVPTYRTGSVPETQEARREALQGFVYSPFRAGDLLQGVFGREEKPVVSFQVYDEQLGDEHLLHDSRQFHPAQAMQPALSATTRLTIAGREWILTFAPGPGFEQDSLRSAPPLILLLGGAISALLYSATNSLAAARAAAERSAAELRRSQEALRASEERFRATFNQAAVGIALASPHGRFEQVNQRFCEIVGYSADELTSGMTWQEITHPEDRDTNARLLRSALAGEIPTFSLDKRYLCKGGRIAWVSMSLSVLRNAQGEPEHTISAVRDITARKRAERTVLEQKRELEDFVSIVAHDLKHPVVSMQGLLGLLQQEAAHLLDESSRENLDLALGECNRMKDIIAQLSHLARIGATELKPESVALRPLLERTVQRFKSLVEEKRAAVTIDAPDAVAVFPRLQVEEALDNLVDNALRYGCVGAAPRLGLKATLRDAQVEIQVSDNGPGIDPRYHQRIFEIFRRLNPAGPVQGTGVGLTAVQRLIQRLGGTVQLDSAVGQGATFTIRFPVSVPG